MKQKTTRLSLESFKATAAAQSVKDQIGLITGGAMAACHPVKPV